MIVGSHFARNGRQGVGFTAARNVNIAGNSFSDVRAATFDFEPALADGVDCVSVTNNIVGIGRQLFVAADGYGLVNHVTFSGNRLTGQPLQIWSKNNTPGLRNGWQIFANTSNVVYGTPAGAVMQITRGNGFAIHDNTQPFQPKRNMVLALVASSCNVVVSNNVLPGSVGESRTSGTC